MRLRVVIHHGQMLPDAHGYTGVSLAHAARLLDADTVRDSLAGSPTATAIMVVSDGVYRGVVR